MLRNILFFTVILSSSCSITKGIVDSLDPLQTPFEKDENYSSSYHEAVEYYKLLDRTSLYIKVSEFGMTDSGNPLHEVVIDKAKDFTPNGARQSDKAVLFVNNGIHAGEPCGIDASMMLARDLINEKSELLDSTVIVIIPVYNVGGSKNRGSYSRANQNGPKAYGFRGNAKNLDLNRDFIKQDSKNAQSFNRLFNKWNPDVLIDNHTSNGADYQYVITLIATQKDKLEANLSRFMSQEMLPFLYPQMKAKGYEMTPYVYSRSTPDNGIAGFLDLPRYSSGYAALHNTISFMPETHMFKPYKDRVKSVYLFMESMLEFIASNKTSLLDVRKRANANTAIQEKFDLNWTLDSEKEEKLMFKGYESKEKKSKVTGQMRMYYDRTAPYEKEVPFYNTYKSTLEIQKPDFYIVPQGYTEVIERLKWNGVKMEVIPEDRAMEVEVYRIEDFETSKQAYEGHYNHSQVEVSKSKEVVNVYKGDYKIETNQAKNKFIVSVLEPKGPDSYFAWNFFDGILMQKEYFSSYVFEDLAEEILKRDISLKAEFEKKKRNDQKFRDSSYQQLKFIYEHSPHYENTYKRYPIFRLNKKF